jgi:hypothetical protein
MDFFPCETGLYFIGRNFSVVMDEQTAAPVGFNVNFTGMISLAISMGLEFPMKQTDLDGILDIRRMELERFAYDHYGMKIVYIYFPFPFIF